MSSNYQDILWNLWMQTETFAVAIVDETARIMKCNKGFCQLFGVSKEEDEEISLFTKVQSIELRERFLKFQRDKGTRLECIISHVTFGEFMGWSRVEVISLENGRGYLFIFQSLTEAYQAQMVLEAQAMLSDDIFMFFDNSDRILHLSQKAAQLFGFSSGKEAMGVHYSTLMKGKLNIKEVEEVFEQLHQQDAYLGYIMLQQQENNVFYELSGFHVNLREDSVGYVLLFKGINASVLPSYEPNKNQIMLKESVEVGTVYQDEDPEYVETTALFWNSRECKAGIMELKEALNRYEYIVINNLLERIIVLAPEKPYEVLQNIQNAIINFEYEKAISIFEESYSLLES